MYVIDIQITVDEQYLRRFFKRHKLSLRMAKPQNKQDTIQFTEEFADNLVVVVQSVLPVGHYRDLRLLTSLDPPTPPPSMRIMENKKY